MRTKQDEVEKEYVTKIESLEQENTKLRYMLATSNAPCPYCQLARSDMNKCLSGFPGCARADDILMGEIDADRAKGTGTQ